MQFYWPQMIDIHILYNDCLLMYSMIVSLTRLLYFCESACVSDVQCVALVCTIYWLVNDRAYRSEETNNLVRLFYDRSIIMIKLYS